MDSYKDLFMRDTLSDTGAIPSVERDVCHSPDIIPAGTQPFQNPLTLIYDDWNNDLGGDIVQGYYNYIYVRGQNLASNAATGDVYLYYSPSSILLSPQDWKGNSIGDTNPKFTATTHGERVLGDHPFLWNAPPQPDGWHYCLISRVVTQEHPNEIPDSFSSSGEFVDWVRNNPAIAWRNIFIQEPDSLPTKTYLFKFSNMDNFQEKYAIRAECKNMPSGTVVSLVCGSLGPCPPINVKQVLSGSPIEYIYIESILPPNFDGDLTVTIQIQNGEWPSGGEVNPSCLKVVGGDSLCEEQLKNHKLLAKYARHPSCFGLTSADTSEESLVLMGDSRVVFK